MRTTLWNSAAMLALAGLLAACGGGGSGGGAAGGDTGPGATDPSTKLAISAANAGRVAGYPLWASELMLLIGQTASDEVAAASSQPSATVATVSCFSGTLQRSWTDRDGNGILGAGDEVTLDFVACARERLARSAQGRITVLLSSKAANGDFVARVVLPAPGLAMGSVVGAPGPGDVRVSGQTRLELSRGPLRHMLLLGGGTGDEFVFDFPGSRFAADRITEFRLEKTHLWDEARTLLDIRMRYDSPELGGSFDVAMPAPLRSWLDELPEAGAQQGSFTMRGRGGDVVTLLIGNGNGGPSDLSLILDIGGDGSVEGRGTGSWNGIGFVSGVFFADYTPGGRGNAFAHSPSEFSLRLPFVGGSELPVDASFSLQFTRPVAGAAAWRWRLLDKGRLDQMPMAGTEVPVEVVAQGARIVVKPVQPLRYSRRYELLVDTGEAAGNGQLMRATTGGTLSRHAGSMGEFTTPNFLASGANLGGRVTLLAGTTFEAIGVPPVAGTPAGIRYQWAQLSGPPLAFSSPNERTTGIGLLPGSSGVGSATVRLTVSLDGANNIESSDFVLRTVADTSGAWVSRLRVPMDLSNWFAAPKELWSGPAVGTLSASQQGDRLVLSYVEWADPAHPNGDWSLQLGSADGQALRPGTYANAYNSYGFQRPANTPSLDLISGQIQPSSVQGEFVIHELEADGAGRITKLAVDFTSPQGGGPLVSSGAVRINSTRPLPP